MGRCYSLFVRQEEEITGKVAVDPLKKLEEILENEDFDSERISYVQLEPPPSKTPSTFTQLRKRHPRVAIAVAIIIGAAAWSKAVVELFEVLK